MAKFTAYKQTALPTSGIDENGLYFIKGSSDDTFSVHLRGSGDWIDLGVLNSVESVNNLIGEIEADLSFSNGVLKLNVTGDGTAMGTTSITLIDDNASGSNKTYSSEKILSLLGQAGYGDMLKSMYDPTGVEGDAFDYNNMHNTPSIGNGKITVSIGGVPLVEFTMNQAGDDTLDLTPFLITVEDNLTSTSAENALSAKQGKVLKDLIDGLTNTVSSGVNIQGGYNANTETNFPGGGNALKGNAWYITTAGIIQGEEFEPGDMLIANTDNASATNISDWIAIQTNIGQATESVSGHAKIATTAQAKAGTNDTNIMTAKKVKEAIEELGQILTSSTSIDIVSGQIRTKAITGDVSIAANAVTSTINNNAVTTEKINNKAVTLAKIQDISANRILGRYSGSTGVVQQIKLGDNLEFDSDTLQVSWGTNDW